MTDGGLPDFWYWLNSNILMSSEDFTETKKSLFLHAFYEIQVCFFCFLYKDNANNKNHQHGLTLFLLIMQINFMLQCHPSPFGTIKTIIRFHDFSCGLKCGHDILSFSLSLYIAINYLLLWVSCSRNHQLNNFSYVMVLQ